MKKNKSKKTKGWSSGNVSAKKASAAAVKNFEEPVEKSKTKGVAELLALGKEKGFLTYDDINRILPSHVTSSDEIDDVLMRLTSEQIDVVESAEGAASSDDDADEDSEKEAELDENSDKEEAKKEEPEAAPVSPSRLEQMDDPVRMYLRQMGQISLLTRDEELELAKRIEADELEFRKVVFESLYSRQYILDFSNKLLRHEVPIEEYIDEELKHRDNASRTIKRLKILTRRLRGAKRSTNVMELDRKSVV